MINNSNQQIMVNKIKRIANFYGERYKKEIMKSEKWTSKLLSNDWFFALEFWFNKSFFRGRKDSISMDFMEKAIQVIANIGKENILNISNEKIESSLYKAGVNNHIDRKMVVETINFIKNLNDNNLVNYCTDAIERNQALNVFNELQTIFGIGPKLASLFLRDVCFVYEIEPIDKKQLICLQPIDTWVRQVAVKLKIPGCTKDTNNIKVVEPVVDFCLDNHISPLLFNAGAWYVGARAFSLFLESLQH